MILMASPDWALVLIAAVVGLCVGSFLNVVIYRLPIIYGVVGTLPDRPFDLCRPRSHCPACQQTLSVIDLLPLFGYLLRRGRCRYCQAPISRQYPLIELVSAVCAVLLVFRFEDTPTLLAAGVFTAACIVITVIDLKHFLVFDELSLGLLWAGLLASVVVPFSHSPTESILGAAIGYSGLTAIIRLHHRITGTVGMGGGDVKLLAALGAWFGVCALPWLLLASSVGGILAFIAIGLRRGFVRERRLPFAPYLIGAGLIALYFPQIVTSLFCTV